MRFDTQCFLLKDRLLNPGDPKGQTANDKSLRDFKLRHRGVRKNWDVPDSFPNSAIVEAYMHPQIDSSKEKIIFGKPDLDLLKPFCW